MIYLISLSIAEIQLREQHLDQCSGSSELSPDSLEGSPITGIVGIVGVDVDVDVGVDVVRVVVAFGFVIVFSIPVVRIGDALLELVKKPEVGDDPFARDRREAEAGRRRFSGEPLDSIETSGGVVGIVVNQLKSRFFCGGIQNKSVRTAAVYSDRFAMHRL